MPAGEHPFDPAETAPHVLSMQQVTRRLQDLALAPLGVDEQVRISLAGVQQKMVLSRLSTGDWALPVDGRPSTHKIQARGGPSLRAIARLLRERSSGTACREHLLDITMLNMVVGNGDAHATDVIEEAMSWGLR